MVISPVVAGGGGASGGDTGDAGPGDADAGAGDADAGCVGGIWDVLIILVPLHFHIKLKNVFHCLIKHLNIDPIL